MVLKGGGVKELSLSLSTYKGQNLSVTAHLHVMLQLRMSGATSPLPIFLCGLYMDDLACASAFIRHSENSSCPGYWLPFACSLPHYILPVSALYPDVLQLPYFFHAEAGGSSLFQNGFSILIVLFCHTL